MPRLERKAHYKKMEKLSRELYREYKNSWFSLSGYLEPIPLETPVFIGYEVIPVPVIFNSPSKNEKIERLLEICNPQKVFFKKKSYKSIIEISVCSGSAWRSLGVLSKTKCVYYIKGISEEKYNKLTPKEKTWFYLRYSYISKTKKYVPDFGKYDLKLSFNKVYQTHFQPIDGTVQSRESFVRDKLFTQNLAVYTKNSFKSDRWGTEYKKCRYLGKYELKPRLGYRRVAFKTSTKQLIKNNA